MSEKYRTTSFYNGVNTFKTAFPDVADALVEWRERRGPHDESTGDARQTGYRRGNFTQGVLPCSNPDCHEGGYQVDRLIAQMLQVGETEREGVMLCSGREVGEEVRRGPVRCPHRIRYKVTLSLKQGEDQGRERRRYHRRGRSRSGRGSSAA